MDRRQLTYFLAVVDHGGVRRASDALHVAQPSVSVAIQKLERSVGTELFFRTSGGLVLNPTGEALLAPAREVLHSFDVAREIVEKSTGLDVGHVTIASTPTQSAGPMPELIEAFHAQYPNVQVTVLATHGRRGVTSLLRTGRAELGLAATPDGPFDEPEFHGLSLGRQRYVVVHHADVVLPGVGAVSAADLDGQRLIVGQPGSGMRRAADYVLRSTSAQAVVEVEHREALVPLVLRGIGVAIVAEGLRSLAEAAGLTVRDLECGLELDVTLVWPQHRLGPAAQAFVATVSDEFT